MSKKYYAHRTREDNKGTINRPPAHDREERWQPLLVHLENTAALSAGFAAAFGAEEQGRLAGLAHDLGKYADDYQERLEGSTKRVDHAAAGAFECAVRKQLPAAFAVAGHHTGLPDGGHPDDGRKDGAPDNTSTFFGRVNKVLDGRVPPYGAWTTELQLPPLSPPATVPSQPELMFFTRMLYSCLVDADFLDTEAFMADEPVPRGGGDSVEVLEEKLFEYIQKNHFLSDAPEDTLNGQRSAILRQCLDQGARQKPGLFTLTAPTGGSKTVASLAFALCHAKANGLRRVFYVLPFTSIIEQNADVFRQIEGDENVLEHHSGVHYETDENADPQTVRMAKATENWDMPIVVTTAVQFFESLYANRSSKCRRLHNLAESVIIFDEAQILPVANLRPCVHAIAELVKGFRVSAVLCTATQPVLEPLFREFLPDTPAVELCPPGTFRPEPFRRVTFRQAGTLSFAALAEQMNEHKQALCIVNSRESAQTVCRLLDPEGSFHLSTLMYPAHRKAVIAEIRARLKNKEPCRVISTSLIEAGVDISFPAVFRELAGLDSILQAAGRCNREGTASAEDSVVTIFSSENRIPQFLSANVAAAREALKAGAPDSPEAMDRYFRELLTLKDLDSSRILPLIENGEELLPFRTVAEKFRLIGDGSKTVYIPRGDGAELIARLDRGEHSRSLFRSLGQYGVSIYSHEFRALESAGLLTLLDDDTAILRDPEFYSDTTGLKVKFETGMALFL